MALTKKEIIENLNGCEIRTYNYMVETQFGVVMVSDGKVVADGKIIDNNPSKSTLQTLLDDLFYNEFGTTSNKLTDLI